MTGSRSGFHLPVRTGSGSSLPVQVRQNRPVHVLNEQAGGALSRTTEGATPFAFFQRVRILLSATVYLEGKPSVDLILRQEVRCAIEPWARIMSNFTGNVT